MREVSVCHSGYFRAKCAWDELIVVAHARYGRMRINKCVSENFGYVGCSIDVIDVLDRYCSGRRTCHVRVLDETFTESTPCHEDLNLYLQVEYQCLRGYNASNLGVAHWVFRIRSGSCIYGSRACILQAPQTAVIIAYSLTKTKRETIYKGQPPSLHQNSPIFEIQNRNFSRGGTSPLPQ